MKKLFTTLLKDAGLELDGYEFKSTIWCLHWFIGVKLEEYTDTWYGEYFVGDERGKEVMIDSFKNWINELTSLPNSFEETE